MKIRSHKELDVYKLAFEAAETQVWLDFALKCSYISNNVYDELFLKYDNIIGKLVTMSQQPEKWHY